MDGWTFVKSCLELIIVKKPPCVYSFVAAVSKSFHSCFNEFLRTLNWIHTLFLWARLTFNQLIHFISQDMWCKPPVKSPTRFSSNKKPLWRNWGVSFKSVELLKLIHFWLINIINVTLFRNIVASKSLKFAFRGNNVSPCLHSTFDWTLDKFHTFHLQLFIFCWI